MARIKTGDPRDPSVNFGPLVSAQHCEKVVSYLQLGKEEGARLLAGGNRITEGALAQGYYVEPTVFSDCHDEMRLVREEIFGPVMSIPAFDDEEEAITRANATGYGGGRRFHPVAEPRAPRDPSAGSGHLLGEQLGRIPGADAGWRL